MPSLAISIAFASLALLVTSHPTQAQEVPREAQGALAHVMFAYFCPTNDDELSLLLAQKQLDAIGFDEVTANDAFEALESEESPTSEVSEGLGCSMVDQIEREHPFR